MSCKCRGNMRSIISTGHFSNAWPPACKWSIQQFTGMDFFTHGITGHNEVLYCFEDHLVHSVKFRLKIWYIIDSLIRTHDPDDNWPRTTLAFHFSIRNLGGQMVEFSISERKTPNSGLSPPASQCGWCSSNLWRRKRFGTLMVFWSPSQLMEKTTPLKGYSVWQENKLQTLLEQSLSVCKRGKNVHPIEMISSEPFCQFEGL